MNQDERITAEELEFLAKKNKAINFKEELTPEKEKKVFELYRSNIPALQSSLMYVKGLDGATAEVYDYQLAEVDASHFHSEGRERYLIFSYLGGNVEPSHFLIIAQYEIDKMTDGSYKETLHEFELVLNKYYSEMSKGFLTPIKLKAGRVEELEDAIRSNPSLIEGDYEVKHFEITKKGSNMKMYLLSDISVISDIYGGIDYLEQEPEELESFETEAEELEEEAVEEMDELIEVDNDVYDRPFVVVQNEQQQEESLNNNSVVNNNNTNVSLIGGNVMKKEFIEGEKTELYKPKFGQLNPTGDFSEPLGELGLLGGVPMDITVVLGSTKALLSEVRDFGVGKIIELNKSEDDPLLIYLNGELMAEGEVVIVDENYAIKITKLYQEKVVKAGI